MDDAPTIFNPRLAAAAGSTVTPSSVDPFGRAVKACQFGELDVLEDLVETTGGGADDTVRLTPSP
ncbi:unnamed protein product [Choristocarpus tenellus]